MNIRITIQYHTQWGESLVLRIGKKRYPMDPAYANIWQKELRLSVGSGGRTGMKRLPAVRPW